jgi:hypothetical protein
MAKLETFQTVKHFKPEEFRYPDKVDDDTLLQLDAMRENEKGIYIIVTSDYRPGDPKWHGKGKALDIIMMDRLLNLPLPVIKQFLIASKYCWTGIGIYPYWTNEIGKRMPGVHVDTRPMRRFGWRATWWRDRVGKYRGIDELFRRLYNWQVLEECL